MPKGWLFALGALVLCAGRLPAAESASGVDPTAADKPASPAAVSPGKLPVTRAELAVTIARVLAGSDAKVPPARPWPSFRDVPEAHWAYRYVEYVKTMGVVSGYPDGNFQPDAIVDRGQIAVCLGRVLVAAHGDSGLVGYLPPLLPTFTDVAPDHWAYLHIEYLADPARRIIQGNPDGTYHPEQPCTRDELASLVARAFPPTKPPATHPVPDKPSAEDHPNTTAPGAPAS